jgi:hypothetical protein
LKNRLLHPSLCGGKSRGKADSRIKCNHPMPASQATDSGVGKGDVSLLQKPASMPSVIACRPSGQHVPGRLTPNIWALLRSSGAQLCLRLR